ncbi:ookinete protein [Anaeramoeba flamelloides]|uniref:Ookinete protein n=1 Tax=Anaeramoeba flamelloides TaxID=1746091 RepID=A0ABQ8ZBY9_9EUKA|nr:ookinete protein [Anaeramoeba flamelloides]
MANYSEYRIFSKAIDLKGPSMKKLKISPLIIESDLGGILPKQNQVNYGISMWLKIDKKHKEWRSIFHNGLINNDRTPGIWIHPNLTTIHFRHGSSAQRNDGVDLQDFQFELNTWYHWTVSVCGSRVVHYVNGKIVQEGNLKGEALMPINDCWLVDPWHQSAEGISISDFFWFPFGISEEFVQSFFLNNPISLDKNIIKLETKIKIKKEIQTQEIEKNPQEEEEKQQFILLQSINSNISGNDYKIIKNIIPLKGSPMKQFKISPIQIESDLGGIKPKKGKVHYGISMWIKIDQKDNEWRSIFHNGLRNNHRTPGIWIIPNSTSIHFRHDSTLQENDGLDLHKVPSSLNTWFHWAVSVCGSQVAHYVNGKLVHKGKLQGEALRPINDCWLVDPWHKSAEGISISDLCWFPFGISKKFVKKVFKNNPISKKKKKRLKKKKKDKEEEKNQEEVENQEEEVEKQKILLKIFNPNIRWDDFKIIKNIIPLKGPSMKKLKISPIQIESNLGGIKPKQNQVNYGISMWIKIDQKYKEHRSIFHNGLRNNHRTPGIWIHPNSTTIHFRHDSNAQKNDGIDLLRFELKLNTWYHWTVSVCGFRVVHYVNGKFVQKGNLQGEALMPINDCWLVDPWYKSAEGISISDLCWFPFGISEEFVQSIYINNPISKKIRKLEFAISNFNPNIKWDDFKIIKKSIPLKGPSMKKLKISPIQIESNLGGIKPKENQVNYGISMWLKIDQKHKEWRSIFHNGLINNHRTPGIWIIPNDTLIHFRHDSTVQENDGLDLQEFRFELNTWYHWVVSVCGFRVVHYVNGKFVKKGNLQGEALRPTKDCWLVDPWHKSAEGISISDFCWFPFGISEDFVQSIYLNNPISMKNLKNEKNKDKKDDREIEKNIISNFNPNIKWDDFKIIKNIIPLKGPSMKKLKISPIQIESDLGGIKPKKGKVHYGISMWIKIDKKHKETRSIFHNGLRNNHRTPGIWIHSNSTLIHFRHDSTAQKNDGIDLHEFQFELNTWYHWVVSVCGFRLVHYVNGKIVKIGNLQGQALMPINDCWLVDPWHRSAEGISISDFCWFPFGISEDFVKLIYLNNPISQEIEKNPQEEEDIKNIKKNLYPNIKWDDYKIIKNIIPLKESSMKKFKISPIQIESDLGGIKPKKGKVHYGISIWIKINKKHDQYRSIFHNGLINNHRTPVIWIHPNSTSIHFRHDSNVQENDGIDLHEFQFELNTWYHWTVSVCGFRVVHYVNGKFVKKANLQGQALRPINDCWLVDPWHKSAEGISISDFCWFPFGISEDFVQSIYINNPISLKKMKKIDQEDQENKKNVIQNFNPNIKWDDFKIIKNIIPLKGQSMKKLKISPIQIESDLGGIKPKKDQVNYGISMWIKIDQKHKETRSIFHNGLRNNHRTPGIWIHSNSTSIHFRHDSNVQKNDGIDLHEFQFELNTWYHWSVSVCGFRVVHYVNGKFVKKGNLQGEALRPINDCWLVDPWHKSAEGISISDLCWFPFGISEEFVQSIYINNTIPKKLNKKIANEIQTKNIIKNLNPNIRWDDYKIIKNIIPLKGPSMKKLKISPIQIESNLGGIKPKENQVNYGISMWIKIDQKHEETRSIFHNGLINNHRTPGIWIHSNSTSIHFRHDSNVQENDGLDLHEFQFELNTWYHWTVSVCGFRVVHYVNGKIVKKGNLQGEALRPINDCWLVDPWHKSAEGISISDFCWFPFGISEDFVKLIYLNNPISKKLKKKKKKGKEKEQNQKEEENQEEEDKGQKTIQNINPNIKWNDFIIIKKSIQLKGPSMKKLKISPIQIESDLGGIKPKKGKVHYGISMWIKIDKKHEETRSIFHNGLRNNHRTPGIWIHSNSTSIHFRHDSTARGNDGIDLHEFHFELNTWYHWVVSVCGFRVVHYVNGNIVKIGNLEGEALMPINDCWLVDPWHKSAEGISINNLCWFPFGISEDFVKLIYQKYK